MEETVRGNKGCAELEKVAVNTDTIMYLSARSGEQMQRMPVSLNCLLKKSASSACWEAKEPCCNQRTMKVNRPILF